MRRRGAGKDGDDGGWRMEDGKGMVLKDGSGQKHPATHRAGERQNEWRPVRVNSTYFQLIPVNSSYFHFPDPRGGMYSRISRFKKIPGRELGRFIPAWSTGRDLL